MRADLSANLDRRARAAAARTRTAGAESPGRAGLPGQQRARRGGPGTALWGHLLCRAGNCRNRSLPLRPTPNPAFAIRFEAGPVNPGRLRNFIESHSPRWEEKEYVRGTLSSTQSSHSSQKDNLKDKSDCPNVPLKSLCLLSYSCWSKESINSSHTVMILFVCSSETGTGDGNPGIIMDYSIILIQENPGLEMD